MKQHNIRKSLHRSIRGIIRKILISSRICAVCLTCCVLSSSADGLQDLTQLLTLFGETGVSSFHLDNFSFSDIDFDTLIRTIGENRKIDYSRLNYDAFLDLLQDPEFLAEAGIEKIDEDALLIWLKEPETGKKINEMMLVVRDGGSFTACMQSLSEDPVFRESFSSITCGKDLFTVAENLTSEKATHLLGKAAAALLTPKSGYPSEAAIILSSLAQNASDTLGWK